MFIVLVLYSMRCCMAVAPLMATMWQKLLKKLVRDLLFPKLLSQNQFKNC